MRICFVGNAFHIRTRSHHFFIELLERIGDVTVLYADLDDGRLIDGTVVETLLNHRFDATIFWQTDHLAQQLIPLNLDRCFLVPMYDSVHHRPSSYWQSFTGHHILSFSRIVHETASAVGARSSYFQFFPEPAPLQDHDFDHPAGFFWERRPGLSLNLDRVAGQAALLGLERLHVHAVADYAGEARDELSQPVSGPPISYSTWFDRAGDFAEAAGRPLFFFAPRPLEGIGMATLEAMARGQIVVAPDLPTANEYIAHLVSGLLYDPASPANAVHFPKLGRDRLCEMSMAARRKVVEGRRTWLMDVDRLLSLIRGDDRRWPTTDVSSHFAGQIRASAHRRAALG